MVQDDSETSATSRHLQQKVTAMVIINTHGLTLSVAHGGVVGKMSTYVFSTSCPRPIREPKHREWVQCPILAWQRQAGMLVVHHLKVGRICSLIKKTVQNKLLTSLYGFNTNKIRIYYRI